MNIPVGAVKESAVTAEGKSRGHHISVKQIYPATSCVSAGAVAVKNGQKYAGFIVKEGSSY